MRIADAHTHFFSRQFFKLLAEEAARAKGGDPDALLLELARKAAMELPEESPSQHARRWLFELDRHGIDRAVAFFKSSCGTSWEYAPPTASGTPILSS